MTAQLIDGNAMRAKVFSEIREELPRLYAYGVVPGLAIIRVGEDPASIAYIRQKRSAARELGYRFHEHVLEASVPQSTVLALIDELNWDSTVHGLLVQFPLPAHLNVGEIASAIQPEKDVDGLHPLNAGWLFQGQRGIRPCTPAGVMRLLDAIGFDPAGKRAVVIGRSNIVGKPMAMLLTAADATTILCHRKSDVPGAVSQADLVVAAIGSPRSIKGRWIKRGAVVIDVGINRIDGKLVGDVEFETAVERASFITPVPGGVGAMTVAMLMLNTLLAARKAMVARQPRVLRYGRTVPAVVNAA